MRRGSALASRLLKKHKARQQAERVSARIALRPIPETSLDGHGGIRTVYPASADVLNASDLPIYEAKVAVPHGDDLHVVRIGFVPGGRAVMPTSRRNSARTWTSSRCRFRFVTLGVGGGFDVRKAT